jgi:hypothetical protein
MFIALLCCALAIPSGGGALTLSTDALAIEFAASGGAVTAVRDLAGGRNLVLNRTVPHSLLAVVYANDSLPTAPATVTLTPSGSGGGGTLVANFASGATVTVVAAIAAGFIELSVSAVTAGSKPITDLHLLTVPVVLESVAAGPVAVFDSAFAMVMLPGDTGWQTSVAVAHPTAQLYSPGAPLYFSGCNGSAGAVLQARAWNLSAEVGGGFVGRSAAVWAGKRPGLDAAIQTAQAKFNLPSPKIDGVWHKRNAKPGYFLITVTPDTLDDAITYAQQSGIPYITFLDNIWAGAGHYNVSTLWGGLPGLTAAVKKIKTAGLKAGCHTMSGNIVKTDAYVTPVPDTRLATTRGGSRTLAAAVGATDSWIPLTESPAGLPVAYGVQQPRLGADMVIGKEIIRYASINTTVPYGLSGVTRGMYGTTAAAHGAATKISHLAQMYGGFLPDPATTLMKEVAENIAFVYKAVGFDMIYFDGLEGHSITGPEIAGAARSVTAPGVAEAGMHQAFWEALDGHDCLTESSSGGGPLWHLNTRTGQTDWAGTDRRAYLDFSKGPDMLAAACKSLDTPDIGWWGYNLFAAGSYRATTPDEVEYMAARVVAWDASPNFETSTAALAGNGRTSEAFARMRPWLSLQLPDATKMTLRAVDTDFLLQTDTTTNQSWIVPAKTHVAHIADPADAASCTWHFNASYPPVVKSRLSVRIRALPSVDASGAAGSVDLLALSDSSTKRSKACTPSGPASGLTSTVVQSPPKGGPAGMSLTAMKLVYNESANHEPHPSVGCSLNLYAAPLNLTINRVLEIAVYGDSSGAVLAIQLQDVGNGFRDYFINLDFVGWKTIRLAQPEGRRLYTHNGGKFPSPVDNKMAMRDFNWGHTLALNVYITGASSSLVYIGSLAALPEAAATVGAGSTLSLAGQSLQIPKLQGFPCAVGGRGPEGGGGHAGENNCEDYYECADLSNASSCQAFDANNNLLKSVAATPTSPVFAAARGGAADEFVYAAAAGSAARVEVTVFERSSEKMGPFGR